MKQYLPVMLGVGAAVLGGFVWMRVAQNRSRRGGRSDRDLDEIDLSSDQSFPASDPPSWTGSSAAPIR
jgi:hypothetical protein